MFSGSLQPTDAQDDNNMYALSYSAESSVMRRFRSVLFINPRHACTARVTVLGSCVCVSVCVCVCLSAPFRPLRVKVSPENDTNASSREDKENKTGDFLKNAPFKSYGVICSLYRRSAVL